MKTTGDYYVVVVEDTNLGQIVATATLITEHKFIHSCAKVYDTQIEVCSVTVDAAISSLHFTIKTNPINNSLINVMIIRRLMIINPVCSSKFKLHIRLLL